MRRSSVTRGARHRGTRPRSRYRRAARRPRARGRPARTARTISASAAGSPRRRARRRRGWRHTDPSGPRFEKQGLNAESPPVAGPPRHSTSLVWTGYPVPRASNRDLQTFFTGGAAPRSGRDPRALRPDRVLAGRAADWNPARKTLQRSADRAGESAARRRPTAAARERRPAAAISAGAGDRQRLAARPSVPAAPSR